MADKYTTNSMGYPLEFSGPTTVEDYDRAAGKVGTCLEDAIENTIYRSTLPEWQDAFGEHLVSLFGERKVNAEMTERAKARSKTPDKVKDVLETWSKYHNRVTAGLDEAARKELAVKAQEIAAGISVDPSPSKRAAGIGKEYRMKAESLMTLPTDQMEGKITTFLGAVDGFDLERDDENKPMTESLARLIKAYIDTLV